MPVAKNKITVGFTVIANAGEYVSPSTVESFDLHEQVDADPKPAKAEARKDKAEK